MYLHAQVNNVYKLVGRYGGAFVCVVFFTFRRALSCDCVLYYIYDCIALIVHVVNNSILS